MSLEIVRISWDAECCRSPTRRRTPPVGGVDQDLVNETLRRRVPGYSDEVLRVVLDRSPDVRARLTV